MARDNNRHTTGKISMIVQAANYAYQAVNCAYFPLCTAINSKHGKCGSGFLKLIVRTLF